MKLAWYPGGTWVLLVWVAMLLVCCEGDRGRSMGLRTSGRECGRRLFAVHNEHGVIDHGCKGDVASKKTAPREVVEMAVRVTRLAELHEVVYVVCFIAGSRCAYVLRGRGAQERRGWGMRSRECVQGVQRASQLVRILGLARAAGVAERSHRGVE